MVCRAAKGNWQERNGQVFVKRMVLMNRFIEAFRNVVLAPTVRQSRALFSSMILADDDFPKEAIEYVKKEYYESENAQMFLECYVYNCGNLHQTTTSWNEGSHAAYRSKTTIIPKPTEAYLRHRIHRKEWITRLRSEAMRARNCIPLDVQYIPELREIAGKVSTFALQQIRQSVMLAKKEIEKYGQRLHLATGICFCPAYARYGLPCVHHIPADCSPVQLEQISPMWRLDNWNDGYFLSRIHLINCRASA